MKNTDKDKRPELPERYQQFLSLADLNETIEMLEIAYQETYNEKVFIALNKLKNALILWKNYIVMKSLKNFLIIRETFLIQSSHG